MGRGGRRDALAVPPARSGRPQRISLRRALGLRGRAPARLAGAARRGGAAGGGRALRGAGLRRLDGAAASRWKGRRLRESFERFEAAPPAEIAREFDAFRSAPEQSSWLDDWTLFAALSERFAPAGWIHWPAPLAAREPEALAKAAAELARERDFHAWIQFLFHRQWERVRQDARRRGIGLVGDVPIYVSHDSADVWAHRELFALDAAGRPEALAGVPPD